tara:strand:+ start:423 stop:677 length:255 start_codon:yes stop_codon:yes gene_type:complete
MYKYKNTSRNNILLYVSDNVQELRPNQVIESEEKLDLPFLHDVTEKKKPIGRPKKTKINFSSEKKTHKTPSKDNINVRDNKTQG